jgi:hypothetical protein
LYEDYKKEILMHLAYQKFSEANSDVHKIRFTWNLCIYPLPFLKRTALTDHRLEDIIHITEAISAVFANFNRPDLH